MYYNEVKEVAKRPEILATIAPFINPATIVPVAAIGTIFFTAVIVIKKLRRENNKLSKEKGALENELDEYVYEAEYEEETEGDEPLTIALNNGSQAVKSTVAQPLNPTVNNYSSSYSSSYSSNGSNTVENMSDEELQKEMIRKTMSELGKRSAAARAKKREIETMPNME